MLHQIPEINNDHDYHEPQKHLLNKLCLNLKLYLFQYLNHKEHITLFKLSSQYYQISKQSIIMQAKYNKEIADFYKQNYALINNECHLYYLNNVYPFLLNADGLYEMITTSNMMALYSYVNTLFSKEKETFDSLHNKKNNEIFNSIRRNLNKIMIIHLNKAFEEEKVCFLDFNSLIPTEKGFEFFLLFLKKNTSIKELDLSKSILTEENLFDLLDLVQMKEEFFTLILSDVIVSQKMIVIINKIVKEDGKKMIKYDQKYTGQSKGMLTPAQVKNKKYKNKKRHEVFRLRDDNE